MCTKFKCRVTWNERRKILYLRCLEDEKLNYILLEANYSKSCLKIYNTA